MKMAEGEKGGDAERSPRRVAHDTPADSGLHILEGVQPPPALNPDAAFRQRAALRRRPPAGELVRGILSGDRVLLSRAVTLIESELAEDQKAASELLDAVMPHTGRSVRIGITGVPGVGKSTFIEAFGLRMVHGGHRVAVLAVDPSSQVSRGSILGDKTRMELLSREPAAYIRPTAAGSVYGGVARRTRETILLCEAAGYDRILVETVGVGQSEILVHSMVDVFLLLALAGAGDELQGMKRGIMEMADAIAITKADGDNSLKARSAAADIARALHLFPMRDDGWTVPVHTCSSMNGEGLDEIEAMVKTFLERTAGFFEERRRRQAVHWLRQAIHDRISLRFDDVIGEHRAEIVRLVEAGLMNPFDAAERLLAVYEDELLHRREKTGEL